jgi:hypothetical protein
MKPASEYLVRGVPAATASEWGGCTLALRFADVVYVFRGLSPIQRDVVTDRFSSLVVPTPVSSDPTDVASDPLAGYPGADFAPAAADAFTPTPDVCWEYDMALDFQADHVDVAGPKFWARLTRATCRAQVRTCLDDRIFLGAFENLFRIASIYRLAQRDTLVIHSAGVSQAGAGYVLFGRSGAGKTTSCELLHARSQADPAAAHAILSDELNAVDLRALAPGVLLQPMPFAGDFGHDTLSSVPVPLRRIYALVQAPEARVGPCARAEALARVVAACPFLNADPFASDSVFERAERLLAAVPLQKLYFPKDPSFWSAVEADVESHAAA